ncbi:enoyl-CoA hydratase/isomerase family protein [Neobacillus sp. D3-1R]|uniref:enoyl-CoA hydratase/isomerase family protein n=1 Tax=Neobacillus sp. D3-1R TaxID=3445778 RepID=UPI003F9F62BA
MKPYLIEEENKILRFTINREEQRNAINFEIMEGLEKVLELGEKGACKALIVTGAGNNAFCSGGDLSVFHDLKTEEEAYHMLSKMAEILYRLLTFPKPTIAIMNGPAVGGGCELATACDFRIARRGIKAGFIQGKLAITTGWGGGSMLLEKMEMANAMKLLMTAEVYEVDKLKDMGFIHQIYDEDGWEAVQVFLEKIVKLESEVLSAYKKLLIGKWESNQLHRRIFDEVRSCAKLWESETHHLQVNRFLTKDGKNK